MPPSMSLTSYSMRPAAVCKRMYIVLYKCVQIL